MKTKPETPRTPSSTRTTAQCAESPANQTTDFAGVKNMISARVAAVEAEKRAREQGVESPADQTTYNSTTPTKVTPAGDVEAAKSFAGVRGAIATPLAEKHASRVVEKRGLSLGGQ